MSDSLECHSDLEGDAPDGSFANRNGRHAIGHVDDYSALQQQVLEGSGLVRRMEAALQSCLNSALLDINSGKVMLNGCRQLKWNALTTSWCFTHSVSFRHWNMTQRRLCSPIRRLCVRFWMRPRLCSRCSGGRRYQAPMAVHVLFRMFVQVQLVLELISQSLNHKSEM